MNKIATVIQNNDQKKQNIGIKTNKFEKNDFFDNKLSMTIFYRT